MKIIYIVNGYPQSGKDTFVKYCKELIIGNVHSKSSIDRVKQIADICGWDGVKNDISRKMLSDMKSLLIKYFNMPFIELIKFVDLMEDDDVLFYMVREPDEIKKNSRLL